MLGRLIKYELRATARIFIPVYSILIALSIIGRICQNFEGIEESFIAVMGIMLIAASFASVAIVTVVLIVKRFWDNLLGREGYLIHVLPVRSSSHILSKLITACIWQILSGIVALLAIFILISGVISESIANADFYSIIVLPFDSLLEHIEENRLGWPLVGFFAKALAAGFAGMLATTLLMYLAMCIGNLAVKHRVWASIGAYVGVNILTNWLGSSISMNFALRLSTAMQGNVISSTLDTLGSVMLSILLLTVAEAIAFFFISDWLLRKRLNLK